MFKAVIFDFDGTLVNSEWAYALTDIEFFNTFGGNFCSIDHYDNVGMGSRAIIKSFKKMLNIKDKSVEELIELNDKIYLEIADGEVTLFPVMVELISKLKEREVPMAVATGSTQHIVETISKQVGLTNYIPEQRLFSSEHVQYEKPQPDILIHVAEQLGVKPEECLLIEDSQTGVIAGKRAGMKVVWLDNLNNKNRLLQNEVLKYYRNGHDGFTPRDILQLFK